MPEPLFQLTTADFDGIEKMLEPLAEAGALVVRDEIVAEMADAPPRTGREYRLPDSQSSYTASAPGEPPAERTGDYLSSWGRTKAVRTATAVVAAAVSDEIHPDGVPAGLRLEEGSQDTEPRPHIRAALQRAAKRFDGLLAQARRPS